MDTLILSLQVILAVVFLTASISKFTSLREFRASLTRLGFSRRAAAWIHIGLPVSELVIVFGILIPSLVRISALAAALLLAAFILVLAINIRRGNRPTCRCFGELTAGQIGWSSVVRNAVLMTSGTCIAIYGPGSVDFSADYTGFDFFVFFAIAILSTVTLSNILFLVYLLKKYGELLRQFDQPGPDFSHSLDIGSEAPNFTLPLISHSQNGEMSLLSLTADVEKMAIIFTSPTCDLCNELYPVIREVKEGGVRRLAVIAIGESEAVSELVDTGSLKSVLHSQDYAVLEAYGVPGIPGAIMVDGDGRIVSLPAVGPGPVKSMIVDLQL